MNISALEVNSRNKQAGEYDKSKIPTMKDFYNLVCAQAGFDAYDLASILKEVIEIITDLSKKL